MSIIYAFLIQCYGLAIRVAALFYPKAKARICGLKKQQHHPLQKIAGGKEIIWIHCASAGEFEQGRPVFEQLKKRFPECFFLLSFFSASGYLAAQKYKEADLMLYLPLDTKTNAQKFVGELNFKMALFVKYEFWYHHLECLHRRKIPVFLISGIFRPGQLFFRSYGKWFLQHLKNIDYFFVQDEYSEKLLKNAGINQVEISGDTRADRVLAVSQQAFDLIEKPAGSSKKTIVCGSIWEKDFDIIAEQIKYFHSRLNWILVPHEISVQGITEMENELNKIEGAEVKLFSSLKKNEGWTILIVDAVGYLSRLYRLGDMAYVGGGFGKGIHNLLEPAAYGIPVMFGPKNEKFREAAALISVGGGAAISQGTELRNQIETWLSNPEKRKKDGNAALGYIKEQSGATERIVAKILLVM